MAKNRIGAGGPFLVPDPPLSAGPTTNGLGAFVSNTAAPQVADYSMLAGIALIFASAVTPQGRANASEYTFGTHAQAVHQAEGLKSQVWGSVRTPPPPAPLHPLWVGQQDTPVQLPAAVWKSASAPPSTSLRSFWAAPQQADLTQQATFVKPGLPTGAVPAPTAATPQPDPFQIAAQIWQSATAAPAITGVTVSPNAPVPPQFDPSVNPSKVWPSAVTPQGQANAVEYTFGLHALALHQAEGVKSFITRSAFTPPAPAVPMPLRSFWSAPEWLDLSISGWSIGGTQTNQGPVPPSTLVPPQFDPSHPAPLVWKSQPAAPPIGRVPPQTRGTPQPDPSQLAPQVWQSVPTPPAILGVTVWPIIVVPAQFDTSTNPTVIWTPSTFSPGEQVGPDTGMGGSSARHPRRIVYVKGDKRKPKTFIDRIGEPFVELERTAEPVPDAASAGASPAEVARLAGALKARLPQFILTPEQAKVKISGGPDESDDDDLLLLS